MNLSESALLANFATAQSLACGDPIMAVVKADAYGHGAAWAAGVLQGHAHCFGVACVEEALTLRRAGISTPIFLLSPALPAERAAVVAQGFRPVVSTVGEAADFDLLAAKAGTRLPVQLVLDTGMGRIGFTPTAALAALPELLAFHHLQVESIASHFPCSDEDASFTLQQISQFRQTVAELAAGGLRPSFVHVANSGGILNFPHAPGELVRAGLMLYGATPQTEHTAKLSPVLTWKARISLVREVPAGHGISYGRTFITSRPTRVATVSAGYADGYPRPLSGKGAAVLVQGCRCPLLGRVTMDQIMVDVTNLTKSPVPGEECVLLGRQGTAEVSASELATLAGTNEWEIFTRIGRRVRRSTEAAPV
ncbi:MAG: alanine racemase [Verrucomicrobiales bacterium]|nr:alanine racemase [Verrucomicrobiales bacterium]